MLKFVVVIQYVIVKVLVRYLSLIILFRINLGCSFEYFDPISQTFHKYNYCAWTFQPFFTVLQFHFY